MFWVYELSNQGKATTTISQAFALMRAIVKPYLGGLHAHEGSCADAMDEASRKRPLEESSILGN